MSLVQGVAADYVLYGYDQVMMGSSRVNVSKTNQLLSLLEGMEAQIKGQINPPKKQISVIIYSVFLVHYIFMEPHSYTVSQRSYKTLKSMGTCFKNVKMCFQISLGPRGFQKFGLHHYIM